MSLKHTKLNFAIRHQKCKYISSTRILWFIIGVIRLTLIFISKVDESENNLLEFNYVNDFINNTMFFIIYNYIENHNIS